MKEILKAEKISKTFNNISAVNDLSFAINQGEIFALLGPNGAGKTTTVRMLMNILRPDSGTITYSLAADQEKGISSELGYLPEERGLYQEKSIIKTLTYMGVIRGIDKKKSRSAAEQWLERLDLKDRQKDKINTLSKGNQQKVQFIASIIHKPSFAILDEPFSGFDPINQELFIEIIRELRASGTTILLSAHQMHLVERVADRILLMNKGRKILDSTISGLNKETASGCKVIITFNGDPDLSILHQRYPDNVNLLNVNEVEVNLVKDNSIPELLSLVTAYDIVKINTVQTSLHDIFLDKIKGDDRVNEK